MERNRRIRSVLTWLYIVNTIGALVSIVILTHGGWNITATCWGLFQLLLGLILFNVGVAKWPVESDRYFDVFHILREDEESIDD